MALAATLNKFVMKSDSERYWHLYSSLEFFMFRVMQTVRKYQNCCCSMKNLANILQKMIINSQWKEEKVLTTKWKANPMIRSFSAINICHLLTPGTMTMSTAFATFLTMTGTDLKVTITISIDIHGRHHGNQNHEEESKFHVIHCARNWNWSSENKKEMNKLMFSLGFDVNDWPFDVVDTSDFGTVVYILEWDRKWLSSWRT